MLPRVAWCPESGGSVNRPVFRCVTDAQYVARATWLTPNYFTGTLLGRLRHLPGTNLGQDVLLDAA
jgi:hypothetical protein